MAPARLTSRLEEPHRFAAYPEGHAVSAPVCSRCGMTREGNPAHARRLTRIRWKRIFSDRRGWRIYGGGGTRN